MHDSRFQSNSPFLLSSLHHFTNTQSSFPNTLPLIQSFLLSLTPPVFLLYSVASRSYSTPFWAACFFRMSRVRVASVSVPHNLIVSRTKEGEGRERRMEWKGREGKGRGVKARGEESFMQRKQKEKETRTKIPNLPLSLTELLLQLLDLLGLVPRGDRRAG